MLVYEQLPRPNPVQEVRRRIRHQVRGEVRPRQPDSTFGGHAWDAYVLLATRDPRGAEEGAARHQGIPRRAARRARELEGGRRARIGVFNMTPSDHNGLDNRARVMVKIENGKWVLVK